MQAWVLSMSHVAHINDSFRTYQWKSYMNAGNYNSNISRKKQAWVMSCEWVISHMSKTLACHVNESFRTRQRLLHINAGKNNSKISRKNQAWVMWMSYVAHLRRQVSHTNAGNAGNAGINRCNASSKKWTRVMSHVWRSRDVTSHTWMSHVTHMNESRHTHEWVTSHTWMSHVTHMNEAHEWVTSHTW